MQKVKSPLLLWTGFMAICIYLFLALLDTDQEHSVLITSPQTEPPSQSEQLHATGAFDPASIRDLAHQGMPVPRKDSIPIDTAQEPSLSYRQLVGIDQQVSIAVEHINYLQNSLSDSNPSVRLQSVQILAEINHADALSLLISALDDPQAGIRLESIEALSSQRDSIIPISLEPLLYDQDKSVRLSAIDAIGSLEHPHSFYALAGLLGDHDADIRLAAVNALGEIASEEVALYLQHQLFDPDHRVRQNVLAILQELKRNQAR